MSEHSWWNSEKSPLISGLVQIKWFSSIDYALSQLVNFHGASHT